LVDGDVDVAMKKLDEAATNLKSAWDKKRTYLQQLSALQDCNDKIKKTVSFEVVKQNSKGIFACA
jgi:hypothetical protein